MIIIINGANKTGNNKIVDYIESIKFSDTVLNLYYDYYIIEAAKQIGWHDSKRLKDRKFIYELRNLSIEYNDYPIKNLLENIIIYNTMSCDIIFCHIDDIKEMEKLKIALNNMNYKINICTLFVYKGNKKYSEISNYLIEQYQYDYYIDITGKSKYIEKQINNILDDLKIDYFKDI